MPTRLSGAQAPTSAHGFARKCRSKSPARPCRQASYSLFIDLKPDHWTLIVSSWPQQTTYDPKNTQALWGCVRLHAG